MTAASKNPIIIASASTITIPKRRREKLQTLRSLIAKARSWTTAALLFQLVILTLVIVLIVTIMVLSFRTQDQFRELESQIQELQDQNPRIVGIIEEEIGQLDRVIQIVTDHINQPPILFSPKPSGDMSVSYRLIKDLDLRQKILDFGREAFPILQDQYGSPWLSWDIVVWENPSIDTAEFRAQVCQPGTSFGSIVVKDLDNILASYVHELAHAYHGCFVLPDSRFEEGMAEAIHEIILQQTGTSTSNTIYTREHYEALNRPGIGGGKDLFYNSEAFIGSLRANLAAAAFRFFEEDHPGFLKGFNEAFYARLYEGEALEEIDPIEVATKIEPSFADWFSQQHVFDERPQGNQILTLFLDPTIYVYGIQRDQELNESAWADLPLSISIWQEGEKLGQTEGRTNENGFLNIDLIEFETALITGVTVTIRVEGGGLYDEFTFTPPLP